MGTRRLTRVACALLLTQPGIVAAQGVAPTDSIGLVDPSRARVVLGATGRMVPEGHGYLVAHYLVLPTLSLGLHPRFTLVAGTAVPFITAGANDTPYWVGGKAGIVQGSGVFAAVGGLHYRVEAGNSSTLMYAVVTGDLDRVSLTVAGLRGFAGEVDDATGVMLGVEWRLDREWTAVAEAWSLPLWGVDPPAVFGLRWSNSRAAFTAGFSSWRAPYVDFAVQW